MPPGTLPCQGHVPFRLLCRNFVCGCNSDHSRQPVKGRQRGIVAEIPSGKNGQLSRVKLLPEAVALIEKYRDDTRGTLFPVIPYQALKWCLTSIKMKAGIKGRLSYHMGRHSFSTLMTLENGVPIETVSKMLGHADIRTTQVYARVTPKKLFEDMDKYIEATKDLKLIL